MFKLGVIEESLENGDTVKVLEPFFVSQRIEETPDDPIPIWHTNEYHVPDNRIADLLSVLEKQIKHTWYAHAFNDEKLIVVLRGKIFHISLHKNETWDAMIAYGESVNVERRYLKNIPLFI